MNPTVILSRMAKREGDGSTNVQGRLTDKEVAELDAAANMQPIPVRRAALVSHILREWLQQQRKKDGKTKKQTD